MVNEFAARADELQASTRPIDARRPAPLARRADSEPLQRHQPMISQQQREFHYSADHAGTRAGLSGAIPFSPRLRQQYSPSLASRMANLNLTVDTDGLSVNDRYHGDDGTMPSHRYASFTPKSLHEQERFGFKPSYEYGTRQQRFDTDPASRNFDSLSLAQHQTVQERMQQNGMAHGQGRLEPMRGLVQQQQQQVYHDDQFIQTNRPTFGSFQQERHQERMQDNTFTRSHSSSTPRGALMQPQSTHQQQQDYARGQRFSSAGIETHQQQAPLQQQRTHSQGMAPTAEAIEESRSIRYADTRGAAYVEAYGGSGSSHADPATMLRHTVPYSKEVRFDDNRYEQEFGCQEHQQVFRGDSNKYQQQQLYHQHEPQHLPQQQFAPPRYHHESRDEYMR